MTNVNELISQMESLLPDIEIEGNALVRCGKTGKPKIDGDPNNLPLSTKLALTEEERKELGIIL